MQERQVLQELRLVATNDDDIERRKKYVGLETGDIERIKSLQELVTRHADSFADTFFDHLAGLSETKALMDRPEEIEQANLLRRDHLVAMVGGEYGRDYVDQRVRLGVLYGKYGVKPGAFLGAFHLLMRVLGNEIMRQFASNPVDGFERFMSLSKICFFDMSIICDVLVAERELVINSHREANASLAAMNLNLEQEARSEAEAANRELEAFSYSVAHDLRAPLRAIDGFSMALLEDYADKVDDEGKQHLQYVRESAQQMGQLIDGLLTLSRLTRAEPRVERVDLAARARAIGAELQNRSPAHQVEFTVAPDAVVNGDPRLLNSVLENLLGNAWKFTRDAPAPRVEFAVEGEGEKRTFVVRDNGVGFDMAHASKLFGAFQRMHSTQEFEGTGIGLATVQRIVSRHGGKVWAHAEVGKGAEFRFTLNEPLLLSEAS